MINTQNRLSVALVVFALGLTALTVGIPRDVKDEAQQLTAEIIEQIRQLEQAATEANASQQRLSDSAELDDFSYQSLVILESRQSLFSNGITVRQSKQSVLKKSLEKVANIVVELDKKIPADAGVNEPHKRAKVDLEAAKAKADDAVSKIDKAADCKVAVAFEVFLTKYYDNLSKNVAGFASLSPDSTAELVLTTCQVGLKETWQSWEILGASNAIADKSFEHAKNTLTALGEPDQPALKEGVSAQQKKLADDLKLVSTGLPQWLEILRKDAETRTAETTAKLAATASGNLAQQANLNTIYDNQKAYLETLNQISVAVVQGKRFWGTPPSYGDLVNTMTLLQVSVSSVLDFVEGDRSQFETRRVSLSYFRDIPRLMRLLNPASNEVQMDSLTDNTANNKNVATGLFDITDGIAKLSQKQAQLIEVRARHQNLQSELSSAQRDVDRVNTTVRQSEINTLRRTQNIATANTEKSAADTAVNEVGISEEEKAKRTKKLNELTKKHQQLVDENEIKAKEDGFLKTDQTIAADKLTAIQTKIQQNTAALETAEAEVATAQQDVSEARREAMGKVIDARDTFVQNISNQPYWYARGYNTSRDPLKRVDFFGLPDSSTLIIRGKPMDLDTAENTVAEFDRPAPQALLTVWSIQVNSIEDDNYNDVTDAMKEVEAILANTRRSSNAVINALQNAVANEVRRVSACTFIPTCITDELDANFRNRLASMHVYNPSVLSSFGIDTNRIQAVADKPTVEQAELTSNLRMAMRLAPDPTRSTTLGEAIMIITLASDGSREKIRNDFNCEIEKLISSMMKDQKERKQESDAWKNALKLSSFWKRLGMQDQAAESAQYAKGQREIVQAIQRDGLGQLWSWLSKRQTLLSNIIQDYQADALSPEQRRSRNYDFEPRMKELSKAYWAFKETDLAETIVTFNNELDAYFLLFYRAFGYFPESSAKFIEFADGESIKGKNGLKEKLNAVSEKTSGQGKLTEESVKSEQVALNELKTLQKHNPETYKMLFDIVRAARIVGRLSDYSIRFNRRDANARISAADEQLKYLIEDIQEDLNTSIVLPNTYAIQEAFRKKHLNVGILQKTSVLGADRHASRVDVGASAALDLGKKNDVLQATQQAIALLSTAQGTNLFGLINGLKSPPEKTPELYALGTGGTFQVTPVFEPSGQAVRFQFNYMPSIIVRDPNGTTNANLPRIEHHSVVTEVQLSNLELREISRFEANYQLGSPGQKTGGIPLLNEIPILKDIPIIGWFSRKGAKKAGSQFSLVLGSSVTYPTISDIVTLLGSPPPSVEPVRGFTKGN